jgi:hypothetical protein
METKMEGKMCTLKHHFPSHRFLYSTSITLSIILFEAYFIYETEVLRELIMQITLLCNIPPCSMEDWYQHFLKSKLHGITLQHMVIFTYDINYILGV